MKKKIFGGIAVLAIAAVAAFNVGLSKSHNNKKLSANMLANIEALAQESGGTNVGWCYFEQSFSGNEWSFKKKCNSNTSNSTIYPCPASETYGRFSDAVKDRCTN